MDTVQIEIRIEDSCTEPKVIVLTASMTEEVSRPEKPLKRQNGGEYEEKNDKTRSFEFSYRHGLWRSDLHCGFVACAVSDCQIQCEKNE